MKKRLFRAWEKIIGEERDGIVPLLPLALLILLSWVYGLCVRARLWMHRRGLLRAGRIDAVVMSVGNLTLGGTGKTPFVIYLARRLRERGIPVAIIAQGYGRKAAAGLLVSEGGGPLVSAEEVGDEAYLFAERLPDIPVLVSRDRVRVGTLAVSRFGSRVIILDDAFQCLGVRREVDLVLVDATRRLRTDRLFPAGYLREPAGGIARASAVVVTRVDESDRDWEKELVSMDAVRTLPIDPVECRFRPMWLFQLLAGERRSLEWLRGRPVIALSGIGNPASFERTLCGLGAEVVSSLRYPDHWWYRARDLEEAQQRAAAAGAQAVITTEKDAVRIAAAGIDDVMGGRDPAGTKAPVLVLVVELEVARGEEGLWGLIDGALADRGVLVKA